MKQQKIEPKFIYEDGKTLCIIVDPDTEEHIKATAAVHPDDLDYESKCENLHGHNYKITIFCRSDKLDSNGMVVDFTLMKKLLK